MEIGPWMKMFSVLAGKNPAAGYPDLLPGRTGTCSEVAGQGHLFLGGETFWLVDCIQGIVILDIQRGIASYIFQESYNTPLEHTPGNPPTQLWKDSLNSLLVKVARGVFQRCVKTTLRYIFQEEFVSQISQRKKKTMFFPKKSPEPSPTWWLNFWWWKTLGKLREPNHAENIMMPFFNVTNHWSKPTDIWNSHQSRFRSRKLSFSASMLNLGSVFYISVLMRLVKFYLESDPSTMLKLSDIADITFLERADGLLLIRQFFWPTRWPTTIE